MTTLSDLTLKQLVAAYIGLTGIEVGRKFFNSRRTGVRRLEALIAEKSLTEADAIRAAGVADDGAAAPETASVPTETTDTTIEAEPEAATDGCEREQAGSYCEEDIPGTEDPPEPGMVWDGTEWGWPPEEKAPPATATATTAAAHEPAPAEDAPAAAPADPSAPPELLADLASRRRTLELFRTALIDAGHDVVAAAAVTGWLDDAIARTLTDRSPTAIRRATAAEPRAARTGTKQEIVLQMLRRPEGTTIEQLVEVTGWQQHSCRGFLSGMIKKKLGLTLTTDRVRMVGPNKVGSPGSYTVYRLTA